MYPIPFPLKTLHPIPLLLSLQILFLNLSLNQLLMILSQNFLLPLLLHLIPPPPMSQPPIILFLTILLLCRPGLSLVLCKPDFIPHYFSESKSVKQAFQDPNCQAAVVATIAAKNNVCSSYWIDIFGKTQFYPSNSPQPLLFFSLSNIHPSIYCIWIYRNFFVSLIFIIYLYVLKPMAFCC